MLGLKLSVPLVLFLQDGMSTRLESAEKEIKETMDAIKEMGLQSIIVYPNVDPGSGLVIRVVESYRKNENMHIYKSLPHNIFLNLMKISSVLVGNSSSGIIEAPSFHLPVVNVGLRQAGRERSGNVIDVGCDKEEIKKAINKAIYDKKFIGKVKKCKNIYGDGKTRGRIIKVLSGVKIDKNLLKKQFVLYRK